MGFEAIAIRRSIGQPGDKNAFMADSPQLYQRGLGLSPGLIPSDPNAKVLAGFIPNVIEIGRITLPFKRCDQLFSTFEVL